MNSHRRLPFCLLICLAWGLRPAAAAPLAAFHVSGAVARPTAWTAGSLGKTFVADTRVVRYTRKGVAHTAHCVPLLSVVQAAQPTFNPHIKNHRLQFVVAVQGFDGYTADFSLAELLPEIGHRAAWLALDEDGRPLPDDAGRVSLIVPEDAKPGRWVHGVVAVTVTDGAQAPPTSGK